jgi:uncharacterized protein YxeA
MDINFYKVFSEYLVKRVNVKLILSLLVGFIFAILADLLGFISLNEIHPSAKNILIGLSILFFIVPVAYLVFCEIEIRRSTSHIQQRRKIRQLEKGNENEEIIKQVIKEVDYLNLGELEYLANCLRKNNTTFKTYILSPDATSLVDKGIVNRSSTIDIYNDGNHPFTISSFAWDHLLKNKAQIIKKHEDEKQLQQAAKRLESKRIGY